MLHTLTLQIQISSEQCKSSRPNCPVIMIKRSSSNYCQFFIRQQVIQNNKNANINYKPKD